MKLTAELEFGGRNNQLQGLFMYFGFDQHLLTGSHREEGSNETCAHRLKRFDIDQLIDAEEALRSGVDERHFPVGCKRKETHADMLDDGLQILKMLFLFRPCLLELLDHLSERSIQRIER